MVLSASQPFLLFLDLFQEQIGFTTRLGVVSLSPVKPLQMSAKVLAAVLLRRSASQTCLWALQETSQSAAWVYVGVCVCVGECVGSLQQKTARVSSHALHSAQCSFCTCHMVRCPRSRTPEHKPSGHCGACQNRFHRSSKSCPILALGTSWQSQLRHHFSSL